MKLLSNFHRLAVSLALAACLVAAGSPAAWAQATVAKKKVSSDADLPRFSYPIPGTASALLLADDATFDAFTRKVSADVESVLAGYDIQDNATLRKFLGARLDLQMLANDGQGATATLATLRDLAEKPDAKAMSGLTSRAIVQAWSESGATAGPAFQQAFSKSFASEVNALPWTVVQDRIKGMKGSYQMLSTDFLVSALKAGADRAALKSGTIDFDTAVGLINDKEYQKVLQPLQPQILAVLTPYIQAHNIQKPDIWPAREVTLTTAQKLTAVRIGIWDSGVDTSLFPQQLFTDSKPGVHSPHGLAFDMQGKIYNGDLQPLEPEQKAIYPQVITLSQGINDLQASIDSPAAEDARKFLSSTPPDQLGPFLKKEEFLGQYMHGTHVAGIAVRGNPAARLVVAQFYDSLPEIPFAPTVEWADRFKAGFAQLGDYFRENNVRVVNMSWADSVSEIEEWLTKTSAEKDPAVRKQFAAQIYAIWKQAVEGAIQRAPNTLFICAAGNSDSNAGFLGDVPASLHLPNLVTVGAVDQAGEETSFTSYGDTVKLHADGFQVESVIPGGTRIKFSGTSMASPNVVNLAAKLIALDPSLTPAQTIALMEKGADPSANGRIHLINPKATVALLPQATQPTAH
ncbi:MAG: S8 family serine peptidase [Acidobacteriota bacterium]|nr:S8 family serine peptidase [Acidobacteriota bacterium]